MQAGHDLLMFDVVVANILRGPLVDLKDRLLGYLKPGGRLMLSGITKEQVCAAYVCLACHVYLYRTCGGIARCLRAGNAPG